MIRLVVGQGYEFKRIFSVHSAIVAARGLSLRRCGVAGSM